MRYVVDRNVVKRRMTVLTMLRACLRRSFMTYVLWPETKSDDVTDRPATLKNACPVLVVQLTCTARPSNLRHCLFRRAIRTVNTLKSWPAKGKNAWPRAVNNDRSFATVSETCCHCWQQPISVSNDHLQSLTIITKTPTTDINKTMHPITCHAANGNELLLTVYSYC